MRVTNKIIMDNARSNINTTKMAADDLMMQISTGKKIQNPSENPSIAVRALRLRSTLAEVTQYRDKNVEDADSWLSLTEAAIESLNKSLEDMIDQCETGSNENLEPQDRRAILEALREIRDEIYTTGDVDYAGRGLFTGYRTNTKLRYEEDTRTLYQITERFDVSAAEELTYVKMSKDGVSISDMNAGNYAEAAYDINETEIGQYTLHRIRLSYDKVDGTGEKDGSLTLTWGGKSLDVTVMPLEGAVDGDGNPADPYLYAQQLSEKNGGAPAAVLIPETGEVILSDSLYQSITEEKAEIGFTYEKTDWEKGDLNPQHYFTCREYREGFPDGVIHNENGVQDQVIEYDVGFNQEIRVNTMASECYGPAIGRDIDDLINMLEQVEDVSGVIDTMERVLTDETLTDEQREVAEKRLASANKALTYLNEKMQRAFEGSITKMQEHMSVATLSLTSVGTRSANLALVKDRLSAQKTQFKDLVSDNEQINEEEVSLKLTDAKEAYDWALSSTSKIVTLTLLNYI